ncbi:MAG: hypothetical protein MJ066_04345 [Clostridia bacterium]|nr:hypothetical protein [Clostridia bacterium]
MKKAVIDIGSNSVRLMLSENNKTLYKIVETTRLANALDKDNNLCGECLNKTLSSLSFFIERAKKEKAEIYVFATAAFRTAKNGQQLKEQIKEQMGVDVDILSGEEESKMGLMGALNGKKGGIIDIGGASTEIGYYDGKTIKYSKSLPIGAVKMTRLFGEDRTKLEEYLLDKIKEYGTIPKIKYRFIGGTASSIASMLLKLEIFDSNKTNGFTVKYKDVKRLCDNLYSKTTEERRNIVGLEKNRADIIHSGVNILYTIMKNFGIKKVNVSESDNLEGYLICKGEKNEKKNEYN